MRLCLVTGGAGFLGSHVVEALVARKYEVRVFDNFSTGRLRNLESVKNDLSLVFGDINNLEAIKEATKGVEVIFHMAQPFFGAGYETGTFNVLHAAREAQVKRVVYASSGRVYGQTTSTPVDESTPCRPADAYASAKLSGEHYCVAFTSACGLETVRLRYFNLFGPRQPDGSPYAAELLRIVTAMLMARQPVVYGDGLRPLDLLYVQDAVQATLLAAELPRLSGKVLNIGRGRTTTILEAVAALRDILKTDTVPCHTANIADDTLQTIADIKKSEIELGFCPSTDLKRGLSQWIEHLIGWRRDELESLSGPAAPSQLLLRARNGRPKLPGTESPQ